MKAHNRPGFLRNRRTQEHPAPSQEPPDPKFVCDLCGLNVSTKYSQTFPPNHHICWWCNKLAPSSWQDAKRLAVATVLRMQRGRLAPEFTADLLIPYRDSGRTRPNQQRFAHINARALARACDEASRPPPRKLLTASREAVTLHPGKRNEEFFYRYTDHSVTTLPNTEPPPRANWRPMLPIERQEEKERQELEHLERRFNQQVSTSEH